MVSSLSGGGSTQVVADTTHHRYGRVALLALVLTCHAPFEPARHVPAMESDPYADVEGDSQQERDEERAQCRVKYIARCSERRALAVRQTCRLVERRTEVLFVV